MLTMRQLGPCLLLLIGIAGCQTSAPRPPTPLTTVTVPDALPIAPPAPIMPEPPAAPALVTTSAPPATAAPPAVAAQLVPATNWVNAWVPLESWSRSNGLGQPLRIPSNPHPKFECRSTNGTLALKVGTRIAQFNGLEYWLGYAPQLFSGQPYVHALDAQKSFQPLLSPARPALLHDRTIVIDPGHGGADSGTRSVWTYQYEKDYTLDCALRLRRLLVAAGWSVWLTRTNDAEVGLPERIAVADRANASLFLSLHFNSGLPNRAMAGLETYSLTPVGMPSHLVRSYEDDPRLAFPNNAFDEQNLQWAMRFHRVLLQATGAADHGVRRARFMGVLRGQNRPAVLIETGYLSNLSEAKKIALPEYRQKVAEAIAKALN